MPSAPKPHGGSNGCLYSTAERNPSLNLLGNCLGNQKSIQLRAFDLTDIDLHLFTGKLL
jgi:hypothetical protein